jgi:hypothetical protein
MNAEGRAEMRKWHLEMIDDGTPSGALYAGTCRGCDAHYPCDAILALDALDELSERVKRAVGLANEYLEDEESLVREDPFTAGTCQVASELLAILTGDGV